MLVRHDVAGEHWMGPPEEFVGWWKTTAKHIFDPAPQRQVSDDTLQGLFEQVLMQPDEADTLYVLTLLMIRRKVLRYEKESADDQGNQRLEVYSLHTNMTYQIPVAIPTPERLDVIQQRIGQTES